MSQSDTAVEAWLSRPATKAEVDAAILYFRRYHPGGGGTVSDTITEFQATIFALGIEILAALEMYAADPEPEEPDPEEPRLGGFSPDDDDDDDDPEPWKRKR